MPQPEHAHRLSGLEPDNLLAFLALLGLLRALEASRDAWRPRACWDLDTLPLRPVLVLHAAATRDDVAEAAVEGLAALADLHNFGGKADLNHTVLEARSLLNAARSAMPDDTTPGAVQFHAAALAAALFSDAAVKEDEDRVEATPLCCLFGQGHQHFLDRLASVPRLPAPPPRGRGKKAEPVTPAACLNEALFAPWTRPDPTQAFRWDPAEDMRYALLAEDPSSVKTTTQHGANRLAAVGLAALAVAPVIQRDRVRLATPGSLRRRQGGFRFAWPIWRDPASLAAIQSLLSHPQLREPGKLAHLSVMEVRETQRISVGKFMNFTPARVLDESGGAAPG